MQSYNKENFLYYHILNIIYYYLLLKFALKACWLKNLVFLKQNFNVFVRYLQIIQDHASHAIVTQLVP